MRRITRCRALLAAIVSALLALTTTVVSAQAASAAELIGNPSAELGTTSPTGWTSRIFGANTSTFTWSTVGRIGTRSLRIDTTARTGGDAKWYFTPVTVTPNTTYTYTYAVRSTVPTQIVAEYKNAAGVITRKYLADAPASPGAWALPTKTFLTPIDATSVTIFHLIAAVGTAEFDDVSLVASTPPAQPELFPNVSLETPTGAAPVSWTTEKFGTNNAVFSYPSTGGRTGARFVRVDISSFTNGDAKWRTSTPLAVTPGTTYRFTDWYRSAGSTEVLAEIALAGGGFTYRAIAQPAPATTWTRYTGVVTMPAGAVSMTIWHALESVGYLETDDYSLRVETGTRFARPLVTLTFDDGHASDVTEALPRLQQNGFAATFYLVTSFLGTPDNLTNAQALQLRDAGMEIGAHTVTHSDLALLNPTQQQAELANSKATLETLIGKPVPNFASPFGSYNASALSLIKGIYGSHRSTLDGYNLRTGTDIYQLKRQTISPTTTVAEVTGWLNQAQADGTWLVLVFHDVGPNPSVSGTTPALFAQMIQAVKASGLTVKTMAGSLAEAVPQLPT